MYLLDTNIVSHLMRRDVESVNDSFARALRLNRTVTMSAIVHAELLFGIYNAPSGKRQRQLADDLVETCQLIAVSDWPAGAAITHAGLRTALVKIGKSIGFMDSLIAAHALAIDATLVTNNEREFQRVPGLKVENWTK
jgi:tRNA(fMet)-specific endonuclease VapC